MTSRISYNIHAQQVVNHNYLITHLQRIQPAAVLVMDGVGLAQEIKGLLPNTIVISRIYPDDEIHKRITPEDWLTQRAPQSAGGIFQYTTNESGFGQELIDWHVRLMELAAIQRVPLVVGNMSVGTPQPEEWHNGRRFLELLDQHRDLFILGLHEYACGVITSGFIGGAPDHAGVPIGEQGGVNLIPSANWPNPAPHECWHMGRFNFLLQACAEMSLNPPRVILTEHNFDNVYDVKQWSDTLVKTPPYTDIRGWKTCVNQWLAWYGEQTNKWSAERAMYEQLTYADRVVYQNSPVEAQLIFCFGAADEWNQFDLENAQEFHQLLEQYAATGTPPDTGDGGEEIPVGKIDLHPYFRGDGRWYDLNHNQQMGGGWETVSTRGEAADARIFLHQKNSQYERMCLHNGFICRDLDTSPGNNEAYRLTDGSTAWSKWCPQFMAVGEKYQRSPTVTFLNKSNGSPVASKPPYTDVSTIQLEKVWASYPIPENTYVIADVIQLAFFPAGATVATERYFYAKRYGLIRWEHQDKRVSFIQHLTTTTTPLPPLEQLGAWANPPTIPQESTTPPPVTYPPKPANASDPVTVVIEGVDSWIVRERPDRDSKQVGTFRVNDAVVFYRNPEENADGYIWHYGECAVSGVRGYCAYVLPEPPAPEPEPPEDEYVKFTMIAEFAAPVGVDVATIQAALDQITALRFTVVERKG